MLLHLSKYSYRSLIHPNTPLLAIIRLGPFRKHALRFCPRLKRRRITIWAHCTRLRGVVSLPACSNAPGQSLTSNRTYRGDKESRTHAYPSDSLRRPSGLALATHPPVHCPKAGPWRSGPPARAFQRVRKYASSVGRKYHQSHPLM